MNKAATNFRSISSSTPRFADDDKSKGLFGGLFGSRSQSTKEAKTKSKEEGEEGSESSLFDAAAPTGPSQPKIFDVMDMNAESIRAREEEAATAKTKTEEDRELEELNRTLDQYEASESETAVSEGEEDSWEKQLAKAEYAKKYLRPEDDAALMEIMKPTPKSAIDAYLSPVQKAVYLRQKTGQEDPLIMGKKYRFKVSRKLEALLEPSVWVKSNTLKGSVKKVTPFLRSLRKMTVPKAIAHCHFNVKNESKHVEALLYRAVEEAKALGMEEKGLYIDQIWSGKETRPTAAEWMKYDYKGRGRAGIKTRKEHHVQLVLKTPVTLKRLAAEKEKKINNKKPWTTLVDTPFYNKKGAHYTW